jgi:hypothetical protein
MDNSRLSQTNNFVQNVSELAETLKNNNIPANRIFDTIVDQMNDLNNTVHDRRGKKPEIEDIELLEEKMDVLASLTEVYLATVRENSNEKEASASQIETVKKTREFVNEYQDSIKRYKSILERNEEVAGKDKDSLAYNKISSITERADFVSNLIHKGADSAVTSLKMMEDYAEGDEHQLSEADKKTIRYGMASASMVERLLMGGEEVQNLRTHVRREGEYENLVSMVAESKEFKELTDVILNSKGVEVFLKDENSGKKLWNKFEGKVRENRTTEAEKSLGTEKSASKSKSKGKGGKAPVISNNTVLERRMETNKEKEKRLDKELKEKKEKEKKLDEKRERKLESPRLKGPRM